MERRPSDMEERLLLLYIMARIGAVTVEQLLLFMLENEVMSFISMHIALAGLDDAGMLRKQNHALGTLYAINGKGRETLEMFVERVPYSRRCRVDEIAEGWRVRFRREKQILADVTPLPDGDFSVRLRLLEYDQALLDLSVIVPTSAQAYRFRRAWMAQAGGVYAYIMHALGEGELKPPS